MAAFGVVIACSFSQSGNPVLIPTSQQSKPTLFPTPTMRPSTQLTATALAQKAPMLETLAAHKDFQWTVNFIQDNVVIAPEGDELRMRPEPFIIQISVSKPEAVYLNALDTDDNFREINSGSSVDDKCVNGIQAFCSFVGMTIVAVPSELVIDQEYKEALHSFYPGPYLGEMGSQFVINDDAIVYERPISFMTLLGELQTIGSSTRQARTEVPLEQLAGQKLYLVFLAKYQPGTIVAADELKKFILIFQ